MKAGFESIENVRVGIDASNIRSGGGVTHLSELLHAAEPTAYGVSRVNVWGGTNTIGRMPGRTWLKKVVEPMLDGNIASRLLWQSFILPRLAKESCDILFYPGGSGSNRFRPYVALSQNLLPFQKDERGRYGMTFIRLRLELLNRIQTRTFRQADGVIFLTDTARRVVEKTTGRLSLTAIVPHGISEVFRMRPRKQRTVDEISKEKPFRWLYVSIIDLYKHQWHVARAVDSLKGNGIPLSLELVGPANPAAQARLLLEIDKLSSKSQLVKYHGPVANNELAKFYHEADGFVFASSCENMPIILLESMASGLPIACSNREPMPEVLKDAGVYFDPESPEQIAQAMTKLMADPKLRANCSARAYEYASQYKWRRCADETFAFLSSVASSMPKR